MAELTEVELRVMDMAADIAIRNGTETVSCRVKLLAESLKIVIAELRAERAKNNKQNGCNQAAASQEV